jgi:transcriptional regulator with XRE-family HTH domain
MAAACRGISCGCAASQKLHCFVRYSGGLAGWVTFAKPAPHFSLLPTLLLVTKIPVRLGETMPKEKPQVNIGEVIKTYRSQRGLSQGDIERRTGLLRCYLSRVENGHTVPSLETLAKIAEAMEISLADFFPGTETPRDKETQKMLGELSQDEIRFLAEIKKYSTTLSDGDKRLVLAMIRKMATLLPVQAGQQMRKPVLRRPTL